MSHFLFIDESGIDRRESPYEVLAGVCVADDRLWPLINAIHQEEIRHFGQRVSAGDGLELKGKKLLKTKVFRHAAQSGAIPPGERVGLVGRALDKMGSPTPLELAALAQAKISFVGELLDI